jgi:hypothetical protein
MGRSGIVLRSLQYATTHSVLGACAVISPSSKISMRPGRSKGGTETGLEMNMPSHGLRGLAKWSWTGMFDTRLA